MPCSVNNAATHPCYLGDSEFDHEFFFHDDSFDHEFGTETVQYFECARCGEQKEIGPGDYGEDRSEDYS